MSIARFCDSSFLRSQLESGRLEVGAEFGRFGRTLLHVAVLNAHTEMVEVLLENGADPLQQDAQGMTPHALASELRGIGQSLGLETRPWMSRYSDVACLLDYSVASQRMWEDDLVPSAPPADAPPALLRLISVTRSAEGAPLPPKPMSLKRTSTVAAHPDVARAEAVLGRRLEQGMQVFNDVGMLCLLSFQDRPNNTPACEPRLASDVDDTDLQKLCGICFDEGEGNLILAPCGISSCTGSYCSSCFKQHVKYSIGELRYALPLVRCPECRRRVPVSTWSRHFGGEFIQHSGFLVKGNDVLRETMTLEEAKVKCLELSGCKGFTFVDGAQDEPVEVFFKSVWDLKPNASKNWLSFQFETQQERLSKAAKALLKIRCPACHQPKDLFSFEQSSVEECELTSAVHSLFPEGVEGMTVGQSFDLAKIAIAFRAGHAADVLLDALDFESRDDEVHPSSDEEAAPRVLPKEPPAKLTERFKTLCSLLGDIERVAALHLAFLRRYPLIKTPCCHADMCFKCKVAGHHKGKTCEERQAEELAIDVQFCPGCGVPTVKSEGCDHIVCVCGCNWTWN